MIQHATGWFGNNWAFERVLLGVKQFTEAHVAASMNLMTKKTVRSDYLIVDERVSRMIGDFSWDGLAKVALLSLTTRTALTFPKSSLQSD